MPDAKAFVDYYAANNISPVSQDISDIDRHLQRRSSLLRQLGVPPAFIRGRSIIEFGPGGGHNAVHLARLGPAAYVLVDGNPTGLELLRANLAEHAPACAPRIELALIENFASEERFDLVLCEGVIPLQNDPAAMARQVASFVVPGGVLVITAVDSVSCLADLLRKIYGQAILTGSRESLADQAERLIPVFKQHLETLPAMSRPHKDWILDTILQPFVGQLFSLASAMDALADDFVFYGSSPVYMTDWRWYKSLFGPARAFGQRAREGYLENVHNLLDHRFVWPPRNPEDNAALLAHGDAIYALCRTRQFAITPQTLDEVAGHVEAIADLVAGFAGQTAQALRDYAVGARGMAKGNPPGDLGAFRSLWGRGQQYVSFLRNDPDRGL
jgi:SAM-dependent methyltransferase